MFLLDLLQLRVGIWKVLRHHWHPHHGLEVFELAAFLEESVILVLQLFHPVILRAEILFQCGQLLGEPLHLHLPHRVLMRKGRMLLD